MFFLSGYVIYPKEKLNEIGSANLSEADARRKKKPKNWWAKPGAKKC
jgi:hypothetical protein